MCHHALSTWRSNFLSYALPSYIWPCRIESTVSQLTEDEWRIYASVNCTSFGSDNGLSPGRRQAIIWPNAGMLLIWPLGTKFSEKCIWKSSRKWRPFCRVFNVLSSCRLFKYFMSTLPCNNPITILDMDFPQQLYLIYNGLFCEDDMSNNYVSRDVWWNRYLTSFH